MYLVKIRKIDPRHRGSDVALPVSVETVGQVETRDAALAFASMWNRFECVVDAWVEQRALVH